jgi:hypothetical protein
MKLTTKTIIRICLFTFAVLTLTRLHAEVSNKKDTSTTESALFNDSDINKVVCKNLPQIQRKISDAVLPGRTDNGRSEAFSQSVLNRPGGDSEFFATDDITLRPSPLIEEHYGNNQVTYKPFWIINGHDFTYTFQIFFPGKADEKNDHNTNSIDILSQQIETNTDLIVKTAHDLFSACDPPFYPSGGSIPPGDSAQVFVCFSSMGLPFGTYQAGLPIGGNAPGSPHYQPLDLHVFPSLPCFWITPQALNELHDNPPQVSTQSIVLANNCSEKIDFIISVLAGDNSKNDGNNKWLSVDPVSGTILPGASLEIEVTFNSSGLVSPGEYNGELEIVSNDPFNPVYLIPVTLELENCGLPPVENFTCDYVNPSTILLEWNPPQSDQHILRWDDGFNYTGIGLNEGGTFMAAARWDTSQLAPYQNWSLTHIAFFPTAAEAIFVLQVLFDDVLIVSQPVISFNDNAWNTIELDEPVQISGLQELFIGYEVTHFAGIYPAGCDAGPAVPGYGDLFNGGTLSGLGLDCNWNLAGYISPVTSDQKNILKHEHDEKAVLLGYNVYCDGVLIATLSPDVTFFLYYDPPYSTHEFIIETVYNECTAMSDPCISVSVSIEEMNQSTFNIYPNPTSGIFTIEGSANHTKVSVFNAFGLEVYRGEKALPAQIDLTEQPRGVYFIRVEIKEAVFTKKAFLK